MADKKSWSRENVLNLISQWQSYPELWDTKHKDFRNRIKKHKLIKALALEFNTTDNEIHRKLHNLRTQFHQELRRIHRKHEEEDEDYRSSWEYFDCMKFISSSSDRNGSRNSDNVKQNRLKIKTESQNTREKIDKPKTITTKISSEKHTELKKAVQLMSEPPDDFQIFGYFVASELRNLKSRENQRKLKLMIQRAIIQISETDESDTRIGSSFTTREEGDDDDDAVSS